MAKADKYPRAIPTQPLPDHWITPTIGTIHNFQLGLQLGLVATHHPALRQIAEPISDDAIQTRDTYELVDQLKRAADGVKDMTNQSLVGLAAPQVGVRRRVFLAMLSDKPPKDFDASALTPIINPRLTIPEGGPTRRLIDGCFSCGPLAAVTERPEEVILDWQDLEGKAHTQPLSPFSSVVVDHENDHLNGVLFPDKVVPGYPVAWIHPERRAKQLTTVAYQLAMYKNTWQQNCPPDQWAAMQDGSFQLANFTLPKQ